MTFPQGLSPSKQRVLAQGEQKRRKENKKEKGKSILHVSCCTFVLLLKKNERKRRKAKSVSIRGSVVLECASRASRGFPEILECAVVWKGSLKKCHLVILVVSSVLVNYPLSKLRPSSVRQNHLRMATREALLAHHAFDVAFIYIRPVFPQSEVLVKFVQETGEKCSEHLAKTFADFRPSISRESVRKTFHEKSSTFSTLHQIKFFHCCNSSEVI